MTVIEVANLYGRLTLSILRASN